MDPITVGIIRATVAGLTTYVIIQSTPIIWKKIRRSKIGKKSTRTFGEIFGINYTSDQR